MPNPAVYWIETAMEANRRDFTVPEGSTEQMPEHGGPTRSSRALALVLLAMHDAYFSVPGYTGPGAGGAPTWLPGLAAPPGVGNPEAAMAGAALGALRGLFTAKRQQEAFTQAMVGFQPTIPMDADSLAWGAEVARAVLDARKSDLNLIDPDSPYAKGRYRHRSDPFAPKPQELHGQLWGACKPFLVPRQTLAEPPQWSGAAAPDQAFYDLEFADVLHKGALTGHTRSAEDTTTGIFWAYDGADRLGTPPRLYCQVAFAVLKDLAPAPAIGTDDYLRLFALMGAAMADSGIQAWYWKYHYDLWRPVVGIREADDSLGPRMGLPAGNITHAQPDWAPLGAPATNQGKRGTPPFPAYPSGHATFGTAAMQVLRRFIEAKGWGGNATHPDASDNIPFTFISDELNGENRDPDGSLRPRHNRKFDSLWQAVLENSVSRVFLGVHWRFDGITRKGAGGKAEHAAILPQTPADIGDVGGVWLGRKIGNHVMDHGF